MDILDLKQRLHENLGGVVEHLLPKGRRMDGRWSAESLLGPITVELSGGGKGGWLHSDKPGGDIIDLWRTVRGIPIGKALDEARDWLGYKRPRMGVPGYRKQYRKPVVRGGAVTVDSFVGSWLHDTAMIEQQTFDTFRLLENGLSLILPRYHGDDLVGVTFRDMTPTADGGEPVIRADDGCAPALFGWQAIPDTARRVAVCWSELDAMVLWQVGVTALAAPPDVVFNDAWISCAFDRLERFEVIDLITVGDKPDPMRIERIVDRLGRHRCRVVELPLPPLAWRQEGFGKTDFSQAFAQGRSLDPEQLRNATDFLGQVLHEFYPADGELPGDPAPWKKAGKLLRFRPGELSVWTGNTGTGKSQVLGFCLLDWIFNRGARAVVASLEMRPAMTLKRMVKQATGLDRPTTEFIQETVERLGEGLWIFDLVGRVKVDELLAAFDYARRRYGCSLFVVDSLMRLGVAGDDYRGQESVMERLVDFAVIHKVHIHMVAHAVKSRMDGYSPGTQIKGSSAIGDNAFNLIEVSRNFKKEKQVAALIAKKEAIPEQIIGEPDVRLVVDKQRNGDWAGTVRLWFDRESYQYLAGPDAKPKRMIHPGPEVEVEEVEEAFF